MTDVGDYETMKTRLLAEPCKTCVLNPAGQRVHLNNARLTQFLRDTVAKDRMVACHSTLAGVAAPGVEPAVCRGFYDHYSTAYLQIIERMWGFTIVPYIDPNSIPPRYVRCGARRSPRARLGCEKPALHEFGCQRHAQWAQTHSARGRGRQWIHWPAATTGMTGRLASSGAS